MPTQLQCCSNVVKARWPRLALNAVPAPDVASRLASELRSRIVPDDGAIDLDCCARLAGATVEHGDLGARTGGRQGLLVPDADDRFRIVVDATPRGGWGHGTNASHEQTARQRRRFLVAHELAHTMFYTRGAGAPRRSMAPGTTEEEAFCDTFARCLLIPAGSGMPTAHGVVRRQRCYDVSLELAARASASTSASITLWRWDAAVDQRRAALHVQWTSDPSLAVQSKVLPYRTDPRDMPSLLTDATRRIGDCFSALVLPGRRQAIAVLGT